MDKPDFPEGSGLDKLTPELHPIGYCNGDPQIPVEECSRVIRSLSGFSSETKGQLVRLCEKGAREFDGMRAVGPGWLATAVADGALFDQRAEHLRQIGFLILELRKRISM